MEGLIAYFDILGYQSFLENNNDALESAKGVLKLINELPEKAKAAVMEAYLAIETENREVAKQVSISVNHLIFSDTILLTIEYPENASDIWKKNALFLLTAMSNYLCGQMFSHGLPLRGAMVEGDFLIKDYCFAGKAIVEAYKISKKINLSGFVIDTNLNNRVLLLFPQNVSLLVNYLTPLHEMKEQEMIHTNWILYYNNPGDMQGISSDVEKFVLCSFWAHNKHCPQTVDIKVQNTCKLIRKFLIATENKPQENTLGY
jgi:hypothetical protein